MDQGRNCPQCGRDIGMLAVIRAPLPDRIRCPHCKARLRYPDTGSILVLVIVLVLIALGVSIRLANGIGLTLWLVFVPLAVIIEGTSALYLRRYGKLEVVG